MSEILRCRFSIIPFNENGAIKYPNRSLLYKCQCKNFQVNDTVDNEEYLVSKVDGTHLKNYSNADVTDLEIENSNIRNIPQNLAIIFPDVLLLYFLRVDLRNLNKNRLKQYPKLHEFVVSGSQIEYLPGDLFEFNESLNSVYIRYSQIKFVNVQTFSRLKNLKNLNFEFNKCADRGWTAGIGTKFDDINEYIVGRCTEPEYVYCNYNENDEHFYSCKVAKFSVHGDIEKIEILGKHKNGKSNIDVTSLIIVSSKNLKEFPKIFGDKFKNLKKIEVSSTIREIRRKSFQNFHQLIELHMPRNKIEFIAPDSFMYNINLEVINFEGNRINDLGISTFWGLKKLQKLNLEYNQCIPRRSENRQEVVSILNSISSTNCSHHDALFCVYRTVNLHFVGRVYTCFGQNSPITKIYYFNYAAGDHQDEYSNDNIEAIRISNYNLKEFPLDLSKTFENLKYIEIKNSKIKILHEESFKNFLNLIFVNLSGNNIVEIFSDIFSNNFRLVSVSFEENHVKNVNGKIFDKNLELNFAFFNGNSCVDFNAIGKVEIEELQDSFDRKCSI